VARGLGAVVVFEEEPDLPTAGAPHAVGVGADPGDGVGGGGVLLGPPTDQPRVRVGARVGDEVDEQLVGAQQVCEFAAADDAFGALVAAARRPGVWPVRVVVGRRVYEHAERAECVEVLGVAGGDVDEPGDGLDVVQCG
jgi:hypothetical protein